MDPAAALFLAAVIGSLIVRAGVAEMDAAEARGRADGMATVARWAREDAERERRERDDG